MFLKSITINNYKSIQKATVSFEDGLNIIIGKNGSGKSNLLEFIYQCISFHTISGMKVMSRNINLDYQFTICYEEDGAHFELIIYLKQDRIISNGEIELSNTINLSKIKDKEFVYQNKTTIIKGDIIHKRRDIIDFLKDLNVIRNYIQTFISFGIPTNSFWLSQPDKYEIDYTLYPFSESSHDDFHIFLDLDDAIEDEFINHVSLKFEDINLDNVKETFSKAFDDFNDKYQLTHNLSKFSPIQEIRINPNINIYKIDNKILVENLLIDFKVNDQWMPWSYLSDGSKRLFYLITQCLSLKEGLILIEEPELGVHPHQLYLLMNFLKEQSEDKQIIISTHSPMVLDILRPDELNRITVAKLEKNGSQFYKLTDEQKTVAKEYMQDVADLSDYWVHSDLENNYAATND